MLPPGPPTPDDIFADDCGSAGQWRDIDLYRYAVYFMVRDCIIAQANIIAGEDVGDAWSDYADIRKDPQAIYYSRFDLAIIAARALIPLNVYGCVIVNRQERRNTGDGDVWKTTMHAVVFPTFIQGPHVNGRRRRIESDIETWLEPYRRNRFVTAMMSS